MPTERDFGAPHDLNLLAALVAGRLGPDERRQLEQHLTECERCRGSLATWSRALPQGAPAPRIALPAWLGAAAAAALAAWIGLRVGSTRPGPVAPVREEGKTEAPAPSAPVLAPTRSGDVSPRDGSSAAPSPEKAPLETKRGGEKRVGDKTFRLVAGEWVDSDFDPVAGLPGVEISGGQARRALLEREPALAPYSRLGDRVTVVFGGTVYRFLPESR